ncbi:MAG: hypothetical protein RLZZ387_2691 [Chloroflexota bacterium]|jgi:hypothetical protein
MTSRRIAILAAMVVGLTLGVVVGPALRGAIASAQTPATTPAAGTLWSPFLDQLAAALNIQRSALDSAIVTAGNSTADAAVQQGTLTQAQADAVKARIQAGDLGALWGGRGGRGGHGAMGGPGKGALAGVHQAMIDAAAQQLGLTSADLVTQLRGGQTLAQLAQAKGVTEQSVTDAALAAAKAQLDAAVTAGTITQAQADAAYTHLQQKGAQLFTPRGRGDRGRWAAPGTPAPTTVPSSTT